jgi:hypothetical protein
MSQSYQYNYNNTRRCCHLCKGNHIAKYCTLNTNANSGSNSNSNPRITNKFNKPDDDVVTNYELGKHEHLPYIDTFNVNASNSASFILRQYFKFDIANQDKLLIDIEEYAQLNYYIWNGTLSRKNIENEMKTLKQKTHGDINKFIAYNGNTIVAKFIIANS